MARFGNNSLELIDQMVENNKPLNTVKTEQYVWRQFEQFCQERSYQLNMNTSNEELAQILKDWAYNMKRNDGEEYKESVVKTIWNITAKLLQQKYFKDFNRPIDPFKDIVFRNAVLAKNAKRRELQAIPEKRKNNAVALNFEDIHKILNTLDEDTPAGLQRKFYHIAAVELAWRGGEAVSCVLDYFKEEIDNYGMKTGRIEYNTVFSKAAQGGNKRTVDNKWLTPNTTNLNYCPVRLWNKMMSKRSKNITTKRLFLTVNKDWNKYTNSVWYKNTPLGRNEINKWTKLGAEIIGLDTKKIKITNHSNRASTVSQLSKAGTSVQEIIKITGHTSANSIQSYLQLNEAHHSRIISNLRSDKSEESSTTTSISASGNDKSGESSTTTSTLTSGNVYNNCTFNINNY